MMKTMKKIYTEPLTTEVCVNGEYILRGDLLPGSNADSTIGGPVSAPARRITVLGSIGGGAGIGSLGSIGHIK